MAAGSGPNSKPRAGTWIVLGALVLLLVLAIVFMVVGWGPSDEGVQMSTNGYLAMTLGIVATLGLGVGLMVLVFHGNRRD